jgi:hypothetical protein
MGMVGKVLADEGCRQSRAVDPRGLKKIAFLLSRPRAHFRSSSPIQPL